MTKTQRSSKVVSQNRNHRHRSIFWIRFLTITNSCVFTNSCVLSQVTKSKTTMKTLTFAEHPLTHITSPSPVKPTTPKLHNRIWRVHAKAKGFDRPSANSQKEKNARIEPIRKMSDEKNAGKDVDNDEKIPEVVFERMIGRILFYVGVPLVTGIVLLRVFDVLKEQHVWDVPLWFAFLTTFITFGASALGIAYGTLSTSWDAEKKGSLLGFEEAQKNWTDIWREEEE